MKNEKSKAISFVCNSDIFGQCCGLIPAADYAPQPLTHPSPVGWRRELEGQK